MLYQETPPGWFGQTIAQATTLSIIPMASATLQMMRSATLETIVDPLQHPKTKNEAEASKFGAVD